MRLLDELLAAFVAQRRMKLAGQVYRPVLSDSSRDITQLVRTLHLTIAAMAAML